MKTVITLLAFAFAAAMPLSAAENAPACCPSCKEAKQCADCKDGKKCDKCTKKEGDKKQDEKKQEPKK